MKKAIVGLAAIGAVVGLRHVIPRIGQKMRDHCEQTMAQFQGRGEATERKTVAQKMRAQCEQMAAPHADRGEPVATT